VNTFMRWIRFNLVGAIGMVVQLPRWLYSTGGHGATTSALRLWR
jgi:hypothetical protein